MGHSTLDKVACASVVVLGFCTYSDPLAPPRIRMKQTRKKRSKVQVGMRDGVTFDSVTAVFTDSDFLGAFRMSRAVFRRLLDLVRPALTRNAEMGRRSKRPTVPADIRLAIALRMFAGGKVWDLVGMFKVKRATINAIFEEVILVLDHYLKWPKFPQSRHELQRHAMDFKLSRRPPSPFNGCIASLDGIAIKIRKPIEVDDAEFYCRKGFYALSVQALVDSHYRFMFSSSLFPGATHDSVAYQASKLWRYIELHGKMCYEFWIVGDEAYMCTEFLITPYPRSELDEDKSAFNFYLSALRNHVEQAFGILTAKWLLLDSPLRYSVAKCNRIVAVLMRLHNWCIDHRSDGDNLRKWMHQSDFRGVYRDTVRWHRQMRRDGTTEREDSEGSEASLQNRESRCDVRVKSKKRDALLRVLKRKGLRRPRVLRG